MGTRALMVGSPRWRDTWPLLAGSALLVVAFAWPGLTGEIHTGRALDAYHLPMRLFYADALANGTDFIWYPHYFGGFYLHGEGQAALYHPANWLLYRGLPFELAFGLEMARPYALLVLGGVLYLRATGLRRDAALLAAATFAFGAYATYHFRHLNVSMILAHLPFMAWAIHTAMCSERPGRVALAVWALSALTASQILLGHPQFLWLNLVCCGFVALYLAVRTRSAARLPWLAAAIVIGFAVGGLQLLPQMEGLADSARAEPNRRYLDRLVIQARGLPVLLSPYIYPPIDQVRAGGYGRHDLYLGASFER